MIPGHCKPAVEARNPEMEGGPGSYGFLTNPSPGSGPGENNMPSKLNGSPGRGGRVWEVP